MSNLEFEPNTDEEKKLVAKAKAREIVQVVMDYGVNQAQIYHMIYLLALELENADHMKKITTTINSLRSEKEPKKSSLITGEDNE